MLNLEISRKWDNENHQQGMEPGTGYLVNIIELMDASKQKEKIEESKYACFLKYKAASNESNPNYCSHVFDGVMCWEEAPPGTRQQQPCPDYIHGFNTFEFAYRDCLSNGSWYSRSESNLDLGWTNYIACSTHHHNSTNSSSAVLQADIDHGDRLKFISSIGYGISLVALVMAVLIMCCSRGLKSKSNILHVNLFIAFIMRASLSFVIRLVFVEGVGLEKDVDRASDGHLVFIEDSSHWECRSIFTMFMYSICASQMWIFMEGLYLFMLIYKTMLTERNGVKLYIILGWSLPLLIIVPWIAMKVYLDGKFCWNIQSKPVYLWIFNGPMLVTVLLNLVFFLNICQVLCSRIRSTERHVGRANRRLAKFILVLIPLFGLYYIIINIVFPLAYTDGFDLVHMYVEMTYNSFQGFILALLFCFLNEEVHSQIKRMWWRRIRRRDSVATRSFVLTSFKRQSRQNRGLSQNGVSRSSRTSSTRNPRSDIEGMEKPGWLLRIKKRFLIFFGVSPYSRTVTDSRNSPEAQNEGSLDDLNFNIMDDENMRCHEDSCSG